MIFTIGHSTHTPDTFAGMLRSAGLDGIIDIRSHPTSKWDWWHGPAAQDWLEQAGFAYEWMPSLGGWDVRHAAYLDWAAPRGVKLNPYLRGFFPKQRTGADADGDFEDRPEWKSLWTSQGLHDYAWYTATAEFLSGIDDLIHRFGYEGQPNVALVCSEAPWWKCHRSMVSDVLVDAKIRVQHVMPAPIKADPTRVRVSDHDAEPRLGRYPSEVLEQWAGGNGVRI